MKKSDMGQKNRFAQEEMQKLQSKGQGTQYEIGQMDVTPTGSSNQYRPNAMQEMAKRTQETRYEIGQMNAGRTSNPLPSGQQYRKNNLQQMQNQQYQFETGQVGQRPVADTENAMNQKYQKKQSTKNPTQ